MSFLKKPNSPSPKLSTRIVSSTDNDVYTITEDDLRDRLQKQEYGRIWSQLYVGVMACISSLSFGTTLGWSYALSTDMVKSKSTLHEDIGLLVSITLLGCSLGISSCLVLMKQLGPKGTIRRIGIFFILTWWLMLIPSMNVQLAGRFFLGFLGITYATAGEALLFQTVHHGIRKYLMVCQNCTVILGVLVIKVVGAATTKFWATVLCASLLMLHYLFIQPLPESPVYLYATSDQAAAKSLSWYRGKGNFYVDMALIKKDWDALRLDTGSYTYMIFSKVVIKPFLIILVITVCQVFTGYFIFMFYSMAVWGAGITVFSRVIDTLIIGICFLLTKLFWGFLHALHPQWRVRGFLLSSFFFSALMLASIAGVLIFKNVEEDINKNFMWCPLLFMCGFLFFFDMGLNQFPRVLILEYMPVQVYKRIDSIIQAVFWLLTFLNVYTFAEAFVSIESYIMFSVFFAITFVGFALCYFFVVEPRNKSLVQIQLEFGGNPVGTRGAIFNQIRLRM